jgi:LuxR family maltose regulon positive regulatory protein
MRVLELLPTYLTLTEIAARLTVSPNTVGTHVRSLHRKLGVASRSGTVQRAIELGLLANPRRSRDD